MVSARLLSVDFPVIDTGIDTAPEAAIFVLIFIYALAAWFNTRIPLTGVEMRPMPRNLLVLLPDFWTCNSRLWRDKLGQISLATTTLFWGVSGNLRYIVLAWAAAALGYSVTQASTLVGVVAIGTAVGAVIASMRMRLDMATSVIPMGIGMGLLVILLNFIDNVWVAAPFLILLGGLGGFLVVPMNALLQHRGHNLMGAGPLHCRAELQRAGLHPGAGRVLQPVHRHGPVGLWRDHRFRHRGGRRDVADQALARQQLRQVQGRGGAPAGNRPPRQHAWVAGPVGARSCPLCWP
jgi:hypothetical protein